MSAYRSTAAQRDAVQAARTQWEQLRSLTAPAVWRVIELIRADDDRTIDELIAASVQTAQSAPAHAEAPHPAADVAEGAPTEATAVVEYDAEGFLVALDAESMVARGLSKQDTDDLRSAYDVLTGTCDPRGRSVNIVRTLDQLAQDQIMALAAAGKPLMNPEVQAPPAVQRVLEKMCDDRSNPGFLVEDGFGKRCFALSLDLEDDEDLPPVKLHFAYTTPGGLARSRGEMVWVIAHQPVWQTYTDQRTGEIRTGQSRWCTELDRSTGQRVAASKFLGVVRTFASNAEALAWYDELRTSLAVVRRITELLQNGDPRYTDDPVRTEGTQRDVTPRMQAQAIG